MGSLCRQMFGNKTHRDRRRADASAGWEPSRKSGRPSPWMRPRCGQSPYQDSGFWRALLEQNLDFKGWNSHVHRGISGNLESANLSRDNHGKNIGRTERDD